jgi:hypothetical protein
MPLKTIAFLVAIHLDCFIPYMPLLSNLYFFFKFQLLSVVQTKINANDIYITVLELDMERPGKKMVRYVLRVRLSFSLSLNS